MNVEIDVEFLGMVMGIARGRSQAKGPVNSRRCVMDTVGSLMHVLGESGEGAAERVKLFGNSFEAAAKSQAEMLKVEYVRFFPEWPEWLEEEVDDG